MNIQASRALVEDIRLLAPRLRTADVDEIYAAIGFPPHGGLSLAAISSEQCWSMTADNGRKINTFGMFGVVKDGCVWMVATPDIEKYALGFLRRCRSWVRVLHRDHPRLWNYVDERNTLHIKWLKWMGFTFTERVEKFGYLGLPFWKFESCASSQASLPLVEPPLLRPLPPVQQPSLPHPLPMAY